MQIDLGAQLKIAVAEFIELQRRGFHKEAFEARCDAYKIRTLMEILRG